MNGEDQLKAPASETGTSRIEAGLSKEVLLPAFRERFGGSVTELRVEPMAGDASTRRYFRVSLSGVTPSTVVLMVLPEPIPPEPARTPYLNIRAFLERLGLPVPGYYFTIPESGIVAVEDCGDTTLESALTDASRTDWETWYREALDSLIRMQAGRGDCCAFSYSFTPDKFEEELRFFLDHAVEGLWGHRVASDQLESLLVEFRRLSESLVSERQVFTHRDFHSRNLMVLKESPRLGILDFQDARLGPPAYDVASLMYDSYVSIPRRMRDSFIRYYRRRWNEIFGERLNPERFDSALRLAAMQRNLKAIGTFAFQGGVLGRKRYLDSIPLALSYVREHAQASPDLNDLWASLSPLLPRAGKM